MTLLNTPNQPPLLIFHTDGSCLSQHSGIKEVKMQARGRGRKGEGKEEGRARMWHGLKTSFKMLRKQPNFSPLKLLSKFCSHLDFSGKTPITSRDLNLLVLSYSKSRSLHVIKHLTKRTYLHFPMNAIFIIL